MKFVILTLLSFFSFATFAQCPFENLSMNDLKDNPDFLYSQQQERAFPHTLFDQFTDELGDLSRCEYAGIAHVVYRPTETLYTLVYSKEDNCDGGNTYGLITRGTQLSASRVVATIKDQDLACLMTPPRPSRAQ